MEHYRALPTHIQHWYDSESPAKIVDHLANEFHFKESPCVILVSIIGDTALGLIKPQEIAMYIQKQIDLPEHVAQMVASRIQMSLVHEGIVRSKQAEGYETSVTKQHTPPRTQEKVIGYANAPQTTPAEPTAERPLVPPYRRPLTDTPAPDRAQEEPDRNPHEGA